MNRTIKFRGKDLLGKWRYGDLVQEKWKSKLNTNEKAFMIKNGNRAATVLENTVGQFTGLHDKNGKEIYEEDIIHINDDFFNEFNYLIEWNEEYLRYYLYSVDKEKLNKLGGILEAHLNSLEVEVIGNIYDNSELLEGE